jgi:FemAB-related protein (PEP-CTERM system-associated)
MLQSHYVSNCDPIASMLWSNLVQHMDHTNLAQVPQWHTAIQQAYRHTPLYLQAEDAAGEQAILPAFVIRRRLFGTVVTSMPFLDAGGPCGSSPRLLHKLVSHLLLEASHTGAGFVELRSTVPLDLPVKPFGDKVNMVLPLPAEPGQLWARFDGKVRNQIRKAERSGLSVEFAQADNLDEFYNIFAQNMRDLGSPVHARGFFQAILDAFGDKAMLVLVRKREQAIGGLFALSFKDSLIVPWASSLRQFFSLCPNMLLYWETIRMASLKGFRRFEFGRSSRDAGTYRFKRQWGAIEEPLFWYSVPLCRQQSQLLSGTDNRIIFFRRLWQKLPLRFTEWFGPRIRKYLTQ